MRYNKSHIVFATDDYIGAVTAMEILGMLFIIVAITCGALKLFFMTDKMRLPKIASAVAIAAGTDFKILFRFYPMISDMYYITLAS